MSAVAQAPVTIAAVRPPRSLSSAVAASCLLLAACGSCDQAGRASGATQDGGEAAAPEAGSTPEGTGTGTGASLEPSVPEGTGIDPAAAPRFDAVTVGTGFVPTTVTGRAGGPTAGPGLQAGCNGWIQSEPNHMVRVETAADLTFDVTPRGDALDDLTLIVRMPDGRFRCSDDVIGLNPQLSLRWDAGNYPVWIGSYAQEGEPAYLFSVTPGLPSGGAMATVGLFPAPIPGGTPAERTSDGTYGGLRVPADVAPITLAGSAGGTREASSVSPGCEGRIANSPDHVFEVLAPAELTIRVASEEDTILVIQGPAGEAFCADDVEGINPVVRQMFEVGSWSLYVGTYRQDGSYPRYDLTLSR